MLLTSSYYFIFYKDTLLLTSLGNIPCCEEMPIVLPTQKHIHQLPNIDNHPCYATSIDEPIIDTNWEMMGLRESFYHLPSKFYNMAGKAYEILNWDMKTLYCGKCGSPMIFHTNISKRCSKCGNEIWPILSPAIIVAITRNEGEEILLVQSKNFKKDYLGLVAGFVETGETLEQCVHREVMEETGLSIKNLHYFASQVWPYPNSLMVGFTAEYASGTLHLQFEELKKGGWYNRKNLPPIPGKVSIARQLIDNWLEK